MDANNIVVIKNVEECKTHDGKSDTAADKGFLVNVCGIYKAKLVSYFRAGKNINDQNGKQGSH